jgi:hypothetical protein
MTALDDMLAPAPAQEDRPERRRKKWLPAVVGCLAVLLLVGLQAIDPIERAAPYDLDSASPSGTKAFRLLMEEAGARVTRQARPAGDTAVLVQDTLTPRETQDLERWVADGGTLIVADVWSSLRVSLLQLDGTNRADKLTPRCAAPYVQGVTSIEPGVERAAPVLVSSDEADVSCFRIESGVYLQEHAVGSGRVIDLAGPAIFTNDKLGKADNAVLLVNLLQPSSRSPVTYLETQDVASVEPIEGETLDELIPDRVKQASLMLLIAGALLIVWRWRRFGKPIEEPMLVRVPASQLTIAVGDLMQTAGRTDAAVAMLRNDLRRTICDIVGLPVTSSPESIAAVAAERTGVDRARLLRVLAETPVDAKSLVAFAQHVEDLHREVTHVR